MQQTRTAVAGYVRVSTEQQADEGVSLDAQRTKLHAYAVAMDLDLVDVFEDAGLSAKSLARPGLQAALVLFARYSASRSATTWCWRSRSSAIIASTVRRKPTWSPSEPARTRFSRRSERAMALSSMADPPTDGQTERSTKGLFLCLIRAPVSNFRGSGSCVYGSWQRSWRRCDSCGIRRRADLVACRPARS